jgi:hypothetical protein
LYANNSIGLLSGNGCGTHLLALFAGFCTYFARFVVCCMLLALGGTGLAKAAAQVYNFFHQKGVAGAEGGTQVAYFGTIQTHFGTLGYVVLYAGNGTFLANNHATHTLVNTLLFILHGSFLVFNFQKIVPVQVRPGLFLFKHVKKSVLQL